MAAPEGNQFWKLRSKHGRDKLFETSELLWDAACEYFQWCEDNPWVKSETITRLSGIDTKDSPTARPFTLEGLALYCDATTSWWRQFKGRLDDVKDKDFVTVVTRIEDVIYKQKFEGAAVGAFNANIIARDLGLKDSQGIDHTTKGESITAKEQDLSNLSTEDLKTFQELQSKIENK